MTRESGKIAVAAVSVAAAFLTGCAHIPGGTNLGEVSKAKGMVNITTGDGTFKDYKATGYHTGTEIGLSVGIPGLVKFFEVYPKQTNEEQLGKLADSAKADGANAMINVASPEENYYGIPFFIFGLHVDKTHGTGISVK